jgi:hypothetical protein
MEKYFVPVKIFQKYILCFQALDTIDGLELQYDSKAGSKYYYTKMGMYRVSITGDAWLIEMAFSASRTRDKF